MAYVTALKWLPTTEYANANTAPHMFNNLRVVILAHLFPRLLRLLVDDTGSVRLVDSLFQSFIPLQLHRWLSCAVGFVLLICSKSPGSPQRWLGYMSLVAYALAFNSYEYVVGAIKGAVLVSELQSASVIGAAICGLPLYLMNQEVRSIDSLLSSLSQPLFEVKHSVPSLSPSTVFLALAMGAALMIIAPNVTRDYRTAHLKAPFLVSSTIRCIAVQILEHSPKQSMWVELAWRVLLVYGTCVAYSGWWI